MTFKLKAVSAAIAAIALSTAPVVAHADEVYFLVGTRHVYRIGRNPELNVQPRQQIEEKYADDVAAAKSDYDGAVNNGQDPAAAADTLNQRLSDAAADRDYQLSQLFMPDDAVLETHPELQIAGDGPYQVIGVNVANRAWVNYTVLAPWPGYSLGVYPYGWHYGVVYSPYAFHHAYLGWYNGWVAGGAPVFVGLWGGGGFLHIGFSASINLGLRAHGFAPGPGFHPGHNWHGSFPTGPHGAFGRPGGFSRPAVGRPGGFGRPGMARPGGGFGRPAVGRPSGGSFGRPAAGRPSGGSFGRPAAGRPGGGCFGRPAAGRPSGGSFGRPAAGRPSGGSFGRPAAGRPSGGSFGRPAAGRPSGGSFGRPSGGGGGRPSGGGGRPSGGGGGRRH
jgi:hypothetical protein